MAEERQILAALSTSQDGAQKEWDWIQSQLQAQRLKLLTVEKDREMLAQNVKELEEQLAQGQEQSRHISAELDATKEKNARLEPWAKRRRQPCGRRQKPSGARRSSCSRSV